MRVLLVSGSTRSGRDGTISDPGFAGALADVWAELARHAGQSAGG